MSNPTESPLHDMPPQKRRGAPKGNRNSVGANTGKRNAALPFETKKVQLTLDAATIETLKRLGNGNLSAGVRHAAKLLADTPPAP